MPQDSEYQTDSNNKDGALSVSQAIYLAKNALECITTTIEGEVSELSNKAGYKAVYFTVKDENASIPCMMWQNRFKAADIDVRIGSLVRITGRFTLYAAKGRMNFDVFSISLAGEGELRQRVANLAKALKAEGLMDAQRKRALPAYPQTIGLVTSPRGAAVRDVLRTLRRLNPFARVVLAGVAVEGADAPRAMAQGLQVVADAGAEVVLLVRGGGSFEDLMPFNDEGLARAIAALSVPVVTGIGHEPDTSIADMVADHRASTPTHAAEAVSTQSAQAADILAQAERRMCRSLESRLQQSALRLDAYASRTIFTNPERLFEADASHLDVMANRLTQAIPNSLRHTQTQLDSAAARLGVVGDSMLESYEASMRLAASRLHDLSPLTILARGYAVAYDTNGGVIADVDSVATGDQVQVQIATGRLTCSVDSIYKSELAPIEWEE